ncbi:hypothetical protein KGG77_gp21 [Streptomyces phage Omar]|uniref:Uncharacterized protein n=1 Tax=Streptomyces phage Omar TaxID=2059882 RepID=A0A2H5BLR3_9CAUD|nr:hypothetical protein KGG77_gp21 [Streptomyces phage Omar]AUG87247.1 hypothetical protein SEA_OMAR_63 [Streptomyces phage Omar]
MSINPLGLEVGDTVELTTDDWEGIVARRGERGTVTEFVADGGTVFTYVRIHDVPFPFEPDEIKKVEAVAEAGA